MLAAGYGSVNIDDCWPLRERDAAGNIVPDPEKFPEGMGGFSKALRAKGIGLGIYTAHGNLTCQKFPGSLGHEKQDAALYKDWGVVFVKNDWCWHNDPRQSAHLDAFNAMRDALNATGVPMVHSIHWNYDDTPGPGCDRGADCPLPDTANMWRIGGDIGPKWSSVLRLIDLNTGMSASAAPGAWNDMVRHDGLKSSASAEFDCVNRSLGTDSSAAWFSLCRSVCDASRWSLQDMLEVGNGMTTVGSTLHCIAVAC